MKRFSLMLAALFAGMLSAQTTVIVNTPNMQCQAALIGESEAASGEYGWWSAWQDRRKAEGASQCPMIEKGVRPGKYTLVVFWENNNDRSDGMALKDVVIHPNMNRVEFEFNMNDFTEWNCLSCPWLCVYNGKDYVKQEEVLKDVTGYENRTTTVTELDSKAVIDGKFRFRIKEEKDEISHLDRIVLRAGDEILEVRAENGDATPALHQIDEDYLKLHKGEHIDLVVELPATWTADQPLKLEVSGFYNPDAEFMAAVTQKLRSK